MSISSAPATGFVLSHPEMGIFLGECLGLGFWSKLDPVGQDAAVAFDSEKEARDLVALHTERCPDLISSDFVVTEVARGDDGFSSLAEIVRAGLPGWDPTLPGYNA